MNSVQTVNKEGDALPAGAMEAKRAANVVVLQDAAKAKAESPPKPSAPKPAASLASSSPSPATSSISKPSAAPQVGQRLLQSTGMSHQTSGHKA